MKILDTEPSQHNFYSADIAYENKFDWPGMEDGGLVVEVSIMRCG